MKSSGFSVIFQRLTPSGEILYKSAKDLISRFDQISLEMRKADSGASGELVIGHIFSPFRDLLPDLTMHFQTEYPDCKIRFIRKNMGPLFDDLSRKELDLIFTMSFGVDNEPGIDWKPLRPDGMSLVVRNDHPLANAGTIDFKKLSSEGFVSLAEGETSPRWAPYLARVCAARGFVPNTIITSATVEGMLMNIKAGFGIAIVPSGIDSGMVPDLKFIEIEGEDTKFFEAVAWRKDNDNPAVPLFLSFLDRFLAG